MSAHSAIIYGFLEIFKQYEQVNFIPCINCIPWKKISLLCRITGNFYRNLGLKGVRESKFTSFWVIFESNSGKFNSQKCNRFMKVYSYESYFVILGPKKCEISSNFESYVEVFGARKKTKQNGGGRSSLYDTASLGPWIIS